MSVFVSATELERRRLRTSAGQHVRDMDRANSIVLHSSQRRIPQASFYLLFSRNLGPRMSGRCLKVACRPCRTGALARPASCQSIARRSRALQNISAKSNADSTTTPLPEIDAPLSGVLTAARRCGWTWRGRAVASTNQICLGIEPFHTQRFSTDELPRLKARGSAST